MLSIESCVTAWSDLIRSFRVIVDHVVRQKKRT